MRLSVRQNKQTNKKILDLHEKCQSKEKAERGREWVPGECVPGWHCTCQDSWHLQGGRSVCPDSLLVEEEVKAHRRWVTYLGLGCCRMVELESEARLRPKLTHWEIFLPLSQVNEGSASPAWSFLSSPPCPCRCSHKRAPLSAYSPHCKERKGRQVAVFRALQMFSGGWSLLYLGSDSLRKGNNVV